MANGKAVGQNGKIGPTGKQRRCQEGESKSELSQ
jgi:hypothetical protein